MSFWKSRMLNCKIYFLKTELRATASLKVSYDLGWSPTGLELSLSSKQEQGLDGNSGPVHDILGTFGVWARRQTAWRDFRLVQSPEITCIHLAAMALEEVVPSKHGLILIPCSTAYPRPIQQLTTPTWVSHNIAWLCGSQAILHDISPWLMWWQDGVKARSERGAWWTQTGLALDHENWDVLTTLRHIKHFFLVNCQQRHFPRKYFQFCSVHSRWTT